MQIEKILNGSMALVLIAGLWGCTKVNKSHYENGNLKSEIQTQGGKYNGPAIWYYSDGKKQHQAFFRNDTLQGESIRWYVNGKVHIIENFKDNHRHGVVKRYDLNGYLVTEENYHLDTLHGTFKQYYTSGQAQIEGSYHKGFFDGQWLYYEDDGTIIGMGDYNQGTGIQRSWYRNGSIKRVIRYKDNEKHGREVWYDAQENETKVLTYEHGEVISMEEFNQQP